MQSLDWAFLAQNFIVASDNFYILLKLEFKEDAVFLETAYLVYKIDPDLLHLRLTWHVIQPYIYHVRLLPGCQTLY